MMESDCEKIVSSVFPELQGSSFRMEHVCSLWDGFGSIYRVKASNRSLILKQVAPPKTNSLSISYKRKLESYKVEYNFYQLGHDIRGCQIASCYYSQTDPMIILLEDLSVQYPLSCSDLGMKELTFALKYLAKFHAYFWNKSNASLNLGSNGSYWYLDTRKKEFSQMPPNSKFKANAELIDGLIRGTHPKSDASKYQTIIHGDPKSANMLFSKTGVAFVDFQYAGISLGVVDVAHTLATSANFKLLETCEEELLSIYYDELMKGLKERFQRGEIFGDNIEQYTREVFRRHYGWAMMDWVRFMEGWGFWGNVQYALKVAEYALNTFLE